MSHKTSLEKSKIRIWYNRRFQGHKMEIIESGNLYAIKHTYPNGHSGILSIEDKPRFQLIDLLLKCGWSLINYD